MQNTNPQEPLSEEQEYPMTREERAELRRRIADWDSPIRYVVMSPLGKRMRFYLEITHDGWVTDLEHATYFKRAVYAKAIIQAFQRARTRDDEDWQIVKITTKGKSPRVVRYLDPSDVPDVDPDL